MRSVPDALVARIESGAARLCHAWVVARADGLRLGFTDHDEDVVLGQAQDEVVCRASSGWTAGAAESGLGGAAGQLSAAGVLDDAALSEADLEAGLWDGAEVELFRVDWSEPTLRVRLWRGRIARVARSGEGFTAEIEGPLAALERVVGRTYGRTCDASLGDARCRVDLGDPANAGATCDKRWRTCVERFANGANFQGFPDIPGDDFLTAVPREGVRHDGGSRR